MLDKPICFYCKHKKRGRLKCSAFKTLIPLEILKNKFFHNKKFPGQVNDDIFFPKEYFDAVNRKEFVPDH